MAGCARSLYRLWLVGVLACLAASGALTAGAELPAIASSPAYQAGGQAIAVEVIEGRASFRLPDAVERGSSLLVVSALARERGSFRVSVSAKAGSLDAASSRLTSVTELCWRTDGGDGSLPAELAGVEPARSLPPMYRQFSLLMRPENPEATTSYLPVQALLRAVGSRVQVYVDRRDEAQVSEAWACQVRDIFENEVEPAFARRWGQARDVDGDGRFTILASSWLDRFGASPSRLDGFVRGADFDGHLPAPLGNQCDMLYLKAGLAPAPHLRTVIAHEYAHAVGFCRKSLGRVGRDGRCLEEEAWLDEAEAHVIEAELGDSSSNLDERVDAFLAEPSRYNLVVPDYQAWGLFRSDGHRGSTFLFLQWCVQRHGPSLLSELWKTDRAGVENLEAATGLAFDDLFRAWTIGLGRQHGERGAKRTNRVGGLGLERLDPDGGVSIRSIAGTAACYFLIDPAPERGLVIRAEGEAAARLQVTLIPMPGQDLPRGIELGRNESQAGGRSD